MKSFKCDECGGPREAGQNCPKCFDEYAEGRMNRNVGQATIESRESTHGDFTLQAGIAHDIKQIMRRSYGWNKLSVEMRESLDMDAVKTSRILSGNPEEPDHWADKSGYALLIHNLLTKGTHL